MDLWAPLWLLVPASASQCPAEQSLHDPWRLILLLSEWSLQAWFSHPERHKLLSLIIFPPTLLSPSLVNPYLIWGKKAQFSIYSSKSIIYCIKCKLKSPGSCKSTSLTSATQKPRPGVFMLCILHRCAFLGVYCMEFGPSSFEGRRRSQGLWRSGWRGVPEEKYCLSPLKQRGVRTQKITYGVSKKDII